MPKSRKLDIGDPLEESTEIVGGKNYLLAVGIDQYKHLGKLKNCVGDARAFVEVLEAHYGFLREHIKELYNEDASQENIIEELEQLSETLGEKDNLIIYFSGHGIYKKRTQMGYLVPVGGKRDKVASLIFNGRIRGYIKGIQAHHIFLVVDSCFSGDLILRSRGEGDPISAIESYAQKVAGKPSRWGLAAGRIEEVADGIAGNHSPFNKTLVTFLKTHASSQFAVSELINHVCKITTYNADQTPIGGILNKAGHQGGEFVFRKKQAKVQVKVDPLQADLTAWNKAKREHSIGAYKAYMKSFPEGEFRELAESRIAQLSATSLKDKDIAAWKLAKEQKSLEGYSAYLRDFPQGEFVLLAERALERVQRKQASLQAQRHRAEKLSAYFEEGKELIEEGAYEDALECFQEALTLAKEGEKGKIEQAIAETEKRLGTSVSNAHPLLQELGIEMVRVEGGSFKLGGEIPCTLSAFQIGKFPITQAQWEKLMGTNPSHFKGCGDCPVEQVSWKDTQKFIEKLNTRTGKKFSLPTEAQWEFAARGGTKSKGYEYAGSNELEEVGWYWKNSGDRPLDGEWDWKRVEENNCQTHPVGQKTPNELGLYDTSGNVWEWCQDWHDPYPEGPLTNPTGPEIGQRRVLRGGSGNGGASSCRVSYRYFYDPASRNGDFGFRLAGDGS